MHIVFFALTSTADYLLSGLRQPSHPARIFSGILPDPFYLLPARRLPALVTSVTCDVSFNLWIGCFCHKVTGCFYLEVGLGLPEVTQFE